MTSTLTKPKAVQVTEIASVDGSSRVDRDAGVIRHVKILGLRSLNKAKVLGLTRNEFGEAVEKPYGYSPHALAEAASLYEGIGVFTNHPDFAYTDTGARLQVGGERKVGERFGKLKNVTAESDGLYGDLHYLKSHDMAERVCEAAETMPDAFALSHNASAHPEKIGDEIVITRIGDVRSVDLVSERPGTTNGLFESAAKEPDISKEPKTMKKTFRQIVESAPKKTKGLRVLEMMIGEEMPEGSAEKPDEEVKAVAEMEMDMPAEAPSPEDALAMAFNAAVSAILEEKISVEEKKERIAKLLDLQEAALSGGKETNAAESESEDDKGKEAAESKALENGKSAVIMESVSILSKAGIPVSETYLEAMSGLSSKERRQAFVADLKKNSAPVIEPQSREGKQVVETAAPNKESVDLSKDPDGAAKLLRGVA